MGGYLKQEKAEAERLRLAEEPEASIVGVVAHLSTAVYVWRVGGPTALPEHYLDRVRAGFDMLAEVVRFKYPDDRTLKYFGRTIRAHMNTTDPVDVGAIDRTSEMMHRYWLTLTLGQK